MYVCMYVYVYICMYMYIYVCMCVCVYCVTLIVGVRRGAESVAVT